MALLYETITSCTAPFIQYAAIEAMMNSNEETYQMVSKYQSRSDVIVDGLNKINGIKCFKPEGTFYAFANIKSFKGADFLTPGGGVPGALGKAGNVLLACPAEEALERAAAYRRRRVRLLLLVPRQHLPAVQLYTDVILVSLNFMLPHSK